VPVPVPSSSGASRSSSAPRSSATPACPGRSA